MTLDPRRIALQGVGFAALVVALQGFVAVDDTVPPVVVSGGGGYRPRPTPMPDNRRQRAEELIPIMGMAAVLLYEENE